MGKLLMGLAVVLVLSPLAACDQKTENTVQPQAKSHFVKPPEQVLAVLETGTDVPLDHPSVSRFRTLLDSVVAKCVNDREDITSSLIEIQTVLENKGIDITLSELLDRIDSNMPELPDGRRLDFNQVAASFRGLATATPQD